MALYIRMGISVIVSLYTSRIVINALGVSDYGLYNLVAGVIGMMAFLNASMTGATTRFLSYEHGIGNPEKIRLTFSNAFIVHLCIAGLFFIIAESVGLWFLNAKVNIDPSKIGIANIIYQITIFSSILNIIQVPYNACIVTNEKFAIYAYFEILNVIFKLAIALFILFVPWHKLELFSVLQFLVVVIFFVITKLYCSNKFYECHVVFKVNKDILKPMLSFSGWDFFGNMSVVFNFQGYGIAMNLFYGTVINAAYGIANTVQGTIKGLAINVIAASRPQIIKQYAEGDISQMNKLIVNATKLSLVLYLCMALPLYHDADYVLHLWLGIVPEFSTALLRIVLIATVFNVANNVINIPIHAVGKMKFFSFTTGTFYILAPLILYFLIKAGMSVYHAFYICVATNLTTLLISMLFVKKYIPTINLKAQIFRTYLPLVLPVALFFILVNFCREIRADFLRLLCDVSLSVGLFGTFAWFYCLDKAKRMEVKRKILSKLKA